MSNSEFEKFIDTSDEWIVSHTGIKNRHLAADNEFTSNLGSKAARIALDRGGIKPEELDCIICATSTPDYPGFPSTACIIQNNLGAMNAGAFDVAAACSGFVYSIEIARNMIMNGAARNILVVGAEIMSRVLDWKDRNTCVLFGDGAGAAVLSSNAGDEHRGILFSILRSEGEGAEYLKIPAGGARLPVSKIHASNSQELFLFMDGRRVYTFALRAFTGIIKSILDIHHLSHDDIDYIIPHQANIRIIEGAAKRLKIPIEKFFINIAEYANTSAATIPIALNEMWEKGMLRKGGLLITVGFGGGLTYGGNLIRW
ncbi:MAG: ketoacyl-ACP synthase III [Spirochaetales bacterium]|nr:ketoacyl-ACP synthase III [Spirochaetales bacterium]